MLEIIYYGRDQQKLETLKLQIEFILLKNRIAASNMEIFADHCKILDFARANKDNVISYWFDIEGNKEKILNTALQIRKIDPRAYFIFVSGGKENSLCCLKLKCFDFLVKPIQKTVLETTVLKLYHDYKMNTVPDKKFIAVKSGSRIYKLDIDEIIYIEKYGQVMVIHTLNEKLRCYMSLEKVSEQLEELNNSQFFRCHKSYLINISHVKDLFIKENMLVMTNGDKCIISRNYKKDLIDILTV
jgi:DNA-binding LytR/AlgR family response regulator